MKLSLTVHNHQPVGNFEYILEDAYKKAYWPFLQLLRDNSSVVVNIHNSGILWDFFLKKHPEYIDTFADLVRKGQIEVICGGYYEPILPVIPDCDIESQLKKYMDFVESSFEQKPKGIWVAERVWNSSLIDKLKQFGLEYTLLDESHFQTVLDKIEGYYTTAFGYSTFSVFPISKELRYNIPYRYPEELIESLKERHEAGIEVMFFGDDGEKFGIWPGTHEWVWKKGWLKKFFSLLSKNQDWIQTVRNSDVLENIKPTKLVYIPPVSYGEMNLWALPLGVQKKINNFPQDISKDGIWENFLAKYSESNNMHKLMLRLSKKIEELKNKSTSDLLKTAYEHLMKGQCNCAYWHGVFGGLYLPHLRHAVHYHIIKGEKALDEASEDKNIFKMEKVDYDFDGYDEINIRNNYYTADVKPHYGGSIVNLCHRDKGLNFTNVVKRREEIYHENIRHPAAAEGKVHSIHEGLNVKEKGLSKLLNYDTYRRYAFVDKIFNETKVDNYELLNLNQLSDKVIMQLTCLKPNVDIIKKYVFYENSIVLEYSAIGKKNEPFEFEICTDFNYNFLDPRSTYCYIDELSYKANKAFNVGRVIEMSILSKLFNVQLNFVLDSWEVRSEPIYTVSLSEAGIEKNYQGNVISLKKNFIVDKVNKTSASVRLTIEDI